MKKETAWKEICAALDLQCADVEVYVSPELGEIPEDTYGYTFIQNIRLKGIMFTTKNNKNPLACIDIKLNVFLYLFHEMQIIISRSMVQGIWLGDRLIIDTPDGDEVDKLIRG